MNPVTTSSIPEHKQWAVNLSQEDFVNEFLRRNPRADAIPLRVEWLNIEPAAPSRSIDAFNPEDMDDADNPVKEHVKDNGPKGFYCRGHGCEFSCTHNIGRISHERKCQHALNTKIPKGK